MTIVITASLSGKKSFPQNLIKIIFQEEPAQYFCLLSIQKYEWYICFTNNNFLLWLFPLSLLSLLLKNGKTQIELIIELQKGAQQ